jgi:CheY-like chemotaxis protein
MAAKTLPHIIVIEDDPQLQRLYCKILDHAGFVVTSASTCQQALRALDKIVPEVILLDVEMPDDSGLAVVDYLRSVRQLPNTYMIVITCFPGYQPQAVAKGADFFLNKPISPKALADFVTYLVRW